MGQASRFRVGEPVLRFDDSDSDASSPSVVSVRSPGFAQVWGHDLRFFPSDEEVTPATSPESLSSRSSRPGLRYRHPQPWSPIDIRPRYMYSAGLLATVLSDSRQARMPMIFQSLEGILFGSQCCAWTLLCLDHHEWLQVVLCNKACHDYVRERASASAIRLPSDPPLPPTGTISSDTTHWPRAQCISQLGPDNISLPISAIIGSSICPSLQECPLDMPRAQDRSMRSPWPNSHNSPAYQFNRGMPTGSASSQLSQWQRLNAGLSGPLAFQHDFSALDDPASSHDAAFASEPYDFNEDGTPPSQPIDLLLSRFRSLDLRVRVLEAERSGAQQALWHHHRAATDSQRLRSLISPWAYMSSKVDAIRVSLQRTMSRLSSLLITLQQSFPTIAQYFTEQALDSASYQGPLLDASDVDTAA